MTAKHNTAIVILAAGHSSRFEGCKVLASVDGKPMLQWAIEKARASVGEHVYVVTGGWQKDLAHAMNQRLVDRVATIDSHDWQKGLGHSIAAATQQLTKHYKSLLILAADQIAVTHDDLNALLNRSDGEHIIAAHYDGQPGIPALFPENYFSDLGQLSGDRGAKKILLAHPDAVIPVACPNATIDIDTRDNLQNWLARAQ